MVTAVEVELLLQRMGRMGSATLTHLVRDELVSGLEGEEVGELGRGCELGKARSKPHPSVDVTARAAKQLELVYANHGSLRVEPDTCSCWWVTSLASRG